MELLISLRDGQRGRIVWSGPDGKKWGKEERHPKFVVVKVVTSKTHDELCVERIGDAIKPGSKRRYTFKVDEAFTKHELADIGASPTWNVPFKSESYIEDSSLSVGP